MKRQLAVLIGGLILTAYARSFDEALNFSLVKRAIVEERLRSFSRDNTERETILKKMFEEAGCGGHMSELPVKHVQQPNLVCVLPGKSSSLIFVGAHFDHVDAGDGVVDNWSGASLLPSLYQGIAHAPREHTYIFIAFAGEEKGELGSESYVRSLTKNEVVSSKAMVNIDTLGLGPTEVWLTHSDQRLTALLNGLARALALPLGAVNVENIGSSDSEQFARRKIPRITVHSITQATWPILHTSRDNLQNMRFDEYWQSYQLLGAYLALLDRSLD
ncbi:MAG TPA: M28 family peptidase [Terriglobales bacterium]|jgi:Zn-dependent M28 family amino/carboxypeptidase|nr:M28 family peptidase [Terriglobales bacterium]